MGPRLAITMAFVALVAGLGTGGFLYARDRAEIEQGLVVEALTIARTTALGIDGDLHRSAMAASEPARTPEFARIRDWMRRSQRANALATDLYTVRLDPSGRLSFGVMTNGLPFPLHPYPANARGDLVEAALRTGRTATSGLYKDENGMWLSAFAPVRDGTGRVVAVLEVDRRADDLYALLVRRAWAVAYVTAAASFVAALFGLAAARVFTTPLRALSRVAERVTEGEFVEVPTLARRDEFGRLSRAFGTMIRALEERDREVERLTLGLVAALERASGENDVDTGEHIRRVADYSTLLAEAAGVERDLVRKIERYAPIHDVGKVGVPDGILKKPGPLTPEETAVMRDHVRSGSEILEAFGSDPVAWNICRYHHERWDGGGYLEGLAGKAIPIEARIVAIADVYDAITTPRCYKPAYSHIQARAIMEEESGRHFDPLLLEAFFRDEEALEWIRVGRVSYRSEVILGRESPETDDAAGPRVSRIG